MVSLGCDGSALGLVRLVAAWSGQAIALERLVGLFGSIGAGVWLWSMVLAVAAMSMASVE